MKMINIKLSQTLTDWTSKDFESCYSIIEEFSFYSSVISKEDFQDLYDRVISLKGDWLSLNIEENQLEIHVEYNLMFNMFTTDKEISIEDEKGVINIKGIIRDFVSEKKEVNTNDTAQFLHSSADYLVLAFKQEGGDYSKDFKQLLATFDKWKVPYIIEHEKSSRVDTGATGGLFEAIILFAMSSVASGILYDKIKELTAKGMKIFKQADMQIIKENVAFHLNTQSANLILRSFDVSPDGFISVSFTFNRNLVEVKVNNKLEILSLNVKDVSGRSI